MDDATYNDLLEREHSLWQASLAAERVAKLAEQEWEAVSDRLNLERLRRATARRLADHMQAQERREQV
jgi:hypothetical protein